jgi:hypothetical protein
MEDPDDFVDDFPAHDDADDGFAHPCDDECDAYAGDKRPRTGAGTAADDHRAEFAMYARPAAAVLPDDLEFMLLDAECLTARVRNDMDDPSADHTPVLHSDCSGRNKRRGSDPFVIGPVVKLYGVCADETSVCVDVYGCYPSFRMQIVRGTPSAQCLERVRNYVEKTVLCPKGGILPDKPRNVVGASLVRAFSAFPYAPEPSAFYEFRLAKPFAVRAMAEHFVKVVEFDDDFSEGGVLGFVPHSGEDALTQYMVGSGVSGFGWVSASSPRDPRTPRGSSSRRPRATTRRTAGGPTCARSRAGSRSPRCA